LLAAGTALFRVASRLRGERAIHARGRAFSGRVDLPGGAATGSPLLDTPRSYDALVRFSRSAGLPPSLPDVFGLAVRLLDAQGPGAHHDLLLDSTRSAPLLRRLPWPGLHPTAPLYGSLLSYVVDGRRVLLGAQVLTAAPAVRALADLPDRMVVALLLATPRGPWRQIGTVTTTGELPAPKGRRTRFSPANWGGGLQPVGPFEAWRQRAYPASHVAPDEL